MHKHDAILTWAVPRVTRLSLCVGACAVVPAVLWGGVRTSSRSGLTTASACDVTCTIAAPTCPVTIDCNSPYNFTDSTNFTSIISENPIPTNLSTGKGTTI